MQQQLEAEVDKEQGEGVSLSLSHSLTQAEFNVQVLTDYRKVHLTFHQMVQASDKERGVKDKKKKRERIISALAADKDI